MGRYILKLTDSKSVDYYLEWSTVVDAPITYGMSLEEFKEHYQAEYGWEGRDDLDERLARVEETGCSSRMENTAESVLSGNRAGPDESCLSEAELIRWYCHEKKEPQ